MELDWLLAPPLPDNMPQQRVIYHRLRNAIASGQLPPNMQLPSSRSLAATLHVARNSILYAYEQLIAEGCLVADRQGTRVAPFLVSSTELTSRNATPSVPLQLSTRASALELGEERGSAALPFTPGEPDYGAFPFRRWRTCLERVWSEVSRGHLTYASQGGDSVLRQAIASYLGTARGLSIDPTQVVITSGTQSALSLCAQLLADYGDTVWVENPGYFAARVVCVLAGLQVHDVSVDSEGLSPKEDDWCRYSPKLIMITPSHQYPTGHVMSLTRRLALIDRARRSRAWIIEDDYDSEFRRAGSAPPAIFALQPDAPVVYTGTFSKTLYPGLRLGYLILPQTIAADFVHLAAQATRTGQGVEQRALAEFIQRGYYTAHLRRMRLRYAARQAALRAALKEGFGQNIVLSGGEAGLHLVMWLPQEIDDKKVVARATELGLGARALTSYSRASAGCNGLVLGYGNLEEGMIDECVRRLVIAVQS